MQRRWITLLVCALAVGVFAMPSTAEARRGRSSPFVKTPYGLIPKSVYNAPFVQNPQKLEQYRKAEQKMMQGQSGSTSKKPTTTKKKT
jgi:hypothetical protein